MKKYIQILSFISRQKQPEFSRYYWGLIEKLEKVTAICHIETQDDKVEFLALAKEEDLELLRKSISNQIITNILGKKTTFVCWVHTFEEFKKGCEQKDFYYENLQRRAVPMFDPDKLFDEFKVAP